MSAANYHTTRCLIEGSIFCSSFLNWRVHAYAGQTIMHSVQGNTAWWECVLNSSGLFYIEITVPQVGWFYHSPKNDHRFSPCYQVGRKLTSPYIGQGLLRYTDPPVISYKLCGSLMAPWWIGTETHFRTKTFTGSTTISAVGISQYPWPLGCCNCAPPIVYSVWRFAVLISPCWSVLERRYCAR